MKRSPRAVGRRSWLASLAALTLAACTSGGGGGAPVPDIISFAATPSTIVAGESTTLAWSVSGATSLSINQGVGIVTGTSVVVSPATTTTYKLTATNDAGSFTVSSSVIVTPAPPRPVIASFTASPTHVAPGGSATLAWHVTGATSLSIDNGVGAVTGTGVLVTPAATTTYTLTATNANGSVTSTAIVTVTAAPLPVFTSFIATPSTIVRGASSTLAWVVTGATALSIDQGVGAVTGTSVAVTPAATTTYTMTATNAAGSVTHSATVTVPAASLLLAGASTGTGLLGSITEFPIDVTGTASTFRDFPGRPYIADEGYDSYGLVWNPADDRFYGVLNGGGAWQTGVLVSFDPATDALVLLKTLSGRTYPAKPGLNGDMFPFDEVQGFYRNPLVTLDGKGLLLLSTHGGVLTEGLLVHVNIDPTSANYLADTVVYDFFDYEVGQGSYCKSIRVGSLAGQTEMAWGKDGSGNDVVFMARVGENYKVVPENPPNMPGNCNPWIYLGETYDKIFGRMFALQPSDRSDLSKPWTFALGYDSPARPGQGPVDPLLHMGRKIHWDASQFGIGATAGVRWTTAGPGDGGQIYFFKGGAATGTQLYWQLQYEAYKPVGMLPLDSFGSSVTLYSGLNGSSDPLIPDSPPRIFDYTRTDDLDLQATLGGWYADQLIFRGATMSMVSRRLFANAGDMGEELFALEASPSRIEEFDPAIGYPARILASAGAATTGLFFQGDPGVGGSIREPIADRYVVWFGTQRLGFSTTLNKHDRVTGLTTTLTFDPVEGAYPKGKLLDLHDGTALGFVERTPPTNATSGKWGYVGGPNAIGSRTGFQVIDLGTGASRGWIRFPIVAQLAFIYFSPEQVRLDDGSVWVATSYTDLHAIPAQDYRVISRLDLAAGVFTPLYEQQEAWNYAPADAYLPAGRKSAALYMPFWQGSVPPFSDHLANVTLGCVRADAGTVNAQSLAFGPASAASGNANRIVYGATYSPANDAMYLATSKVANADVGTIFEIDKAVADASLCRTAPVVTALVTGLADVPSTKPLSTRSGELLYGTSNGKLMRIDVAGRAVAQVADLKAAGAAVSQVKGYLAESSDGTVVTVVFDYDSSGKNTDRRLVSVAVATGAKTSRDVATHIDEWEPYPGVMRRN